VRVVVVSGIFPPDIGGPATHSDDLRRELTDRGHRVTVLTLWDGPCVSDRPGVVRFPRRWTWPVRHAAVAAWLARHRDAYDAVYATGLHPAAVAGARIAGRPVVVKIVGDPVWERGRRLGLTASGFESFRDASPRGGRLGAMRRLRDWSLRHATAITVPSEYLAEVIETWMDGPVDLTVIPNGVRSIDEDDAPARPAGVPLRVISVGRLVSHKRVERLLAAVAATPGVALEVLGTGPEADALVAEADRLGVGDRVSFLGDVAHGTVLRRIRAADALALASDYEGLPHVVIEALATGTPVVAPAVGGVAEVVEDGVGGIVLPDAEIPTLAAALARLRDDEALRRRLRRGAAEAGAGWTMERTGGRIEDLLDRARRGRPRIVMVGKSRWLERMSLSQRRKLELMLPHEDPTFVQIGRAGVRHVGRARAIVLPEGGPLGSALFYAVAPLVAAGLTVGRRRAAVMCLSPYEGVGAVAVTRLVPRALRPRLIVELHGDWRTAAEGYGAGALRGRMGPLADRAARWALRHADAVRAVSRFTEELAREAGARGSIDRYMAFTDAEPLLEASPVLPPGDARVAYAGALEHVKGIDVLVDAWREVRRRIPDATLVIAGEGELRDRIAPGAAALGIELLGAVPHERVASVLDGARFLVVPSRSEGLGRVVWEAFARARPVVGSAVGGIPELVVDGTTGILVPPGDTDALAGAIVAALEDEAVTAAMGERARQTAERRHPGREFEEGIARLAAWVGER
jgi:glycosyltransferase involved in cell wall biosynthesis